MMSEKMKCSINKIFLAATCVFAQLGLTACGGNDGDEPITTTATESQNTVTNFDTSAPRLEFDLSSYLVATTDDEIFTISAVDGDIGLVFDTDFRFDWEFLGPVDVVRDVIYASTTNNDLNAFHVETGEFLWSVDLGESSFSDNPSVPSCSSDHCYVISVQNELFEIRTDTGMISQNFPLDQITSDGNSLTLKEVVDTRIPLINDESIFVGVDFEDGSYALAIYSRQTGALQRSIDFDGQILGPPIAVNDMLLLVVDRALIAIDSSTYDTIWSTVTDLVVTDPVLVDEVALVTIRDPDNVFFSARFGTAGINVNTGEIVWTKPNLELDTAFRPVSDGSLAVVLEPEILATGFSPNRNVGVPAGIDASDGSSLWNLQDIRGRADSEPLAVPGFLFFTDLRVDGQTSRVIAINSRDGSIEFVSAGAAQTFISLRTPNLALVHEGEVFRPGHFPTISKQ